MSNTREWANRMNKDSSSGKILWEYQKDLEEKLNKFCNDASITSINITPSLENTHTFQQKELILIRELCRSFNIKFTETESQFILNKQKSRLG